jgi:hypothetical protein
MTMLRTLCVAIFLLSFTLLPEVAHAQAIYKELRANGNLQREDDPFLFCTKGMKKSNPAWKPDSPASAGYIPQTHKGWCPHPTTSTCCYGKVCFRPWPQEDYDAYTKLRVVVCPAGQKAGKWEGQGDGSKVPHDH